MKIEVQNHTKKGDSMMAAHTSANFGDRFADGGIRVMILDDEGKLQATLVTTIGKSESHHRMGLAQLRAIRDTIDLALEEATK